MMMNLLVKIFLPKHLYKINKSCDLYGSATINCNTVIFYVIDTHDNGDSRLNCIAKICGADDDGRSTQPLLNPNLHLIFAITKQNTIEIDRITVNGKSIVNRCEIFWMEYDLEKVRYLSVRSECAERLESATDSNHQPDDVIELVHLVGHQQNYKAAHELDSSQASVWSRTKYICSLLTILSIVVRPVIDFLKDSTISIHFADWIKCVRRGRRKVWTHIFDSVAGGLIIVFLLWHHRTPGEYFMRIAIYLVRNIQTLLEELGGNPAGLKLNSQLNEFLLNLFQYHADMWIKFLHIVSPAINYLFVLGFVGIFGFSFQLALLSDILVIVTLYAHCFYVYATLLYHIEIMGLQALWRVVLGRRYNTLKKRVESYNYSNAQLYLATFFFAGLIFLLPTVSVYYIVFASIRFIIYCITSVLLKIRRKMLILPIFEYVQWMRGNYTSLENIQLIVVSSRRPPIAKRLKAEIAVQRIEIELKRKFPCNTSRDYEVYNTDEDNILTVSEFLKYLVKGQMMEFITPKQKHIIDKI